MNIFNEPVLRSELQQAIGELGYTTPTPIQEEAIPCILESTTDLIAFAQTGTGKTAAFGLPIVQLTDENSPVTQALVLCPTRELCLQIGRDLESFAKYLKINIVTVYGGTDIRKQIKELQGPSQIVVGTPGRVIDLINRKKLNLENISRLVLDEADEMLSMGFKDELDTILATTPQDKQTLLFSATMPKAIANIAKKYMHNPYEISAGKVNTGSVNVSHSYYMVKASDRYAALRRIADMHPEIYGIVFCRTRRETKEVADKLMADGYNAEALHGDLSQAQRDEAMGRFRKRITQLLVATDVAARGLDVTELTHVINYNLPDDPEVYIHRSGRTGRAGNKGCAVSIISPSEKGKLRMIEKKGNAEFAYCQVPTGSDIYSKRLFALADKVENLQPDAELLPETVEQIVKKLDWMPKEEIISRFIALEMERMGDLRKLSADINATGKERGNKGRGEDRGNDRPAKQQKNKKRTDLTYTRMNINVGRQDRINKGTILGLINKHLPKKSVEVAEIGIKDHYSFFEIDSRFEKDALKAFKKATYNGVRLRVGRD
ncbi:DEAD/DEAH box helicase [Roseivirga sp. BDSF3-8]|uniref:DEAD/DEAH box helicase n=1 Tax=Roseivirga sp. BDSF3-8 TaxID=3241598 RepID=UPI00353262A2